MGRKAVFSASPELMRLLGRKLYKSHPVAIAVRELLQNARDACLRRKQQDPSAPEPRIQIVLSWSDKTKWSLSVEDNGCGMDETTLIDAFLCLGGTDKTGAVPSTGGLGIGAASVFSMDNWSVHTHDIMVTSESIGEDTLSETYVDGTIVKCSYNDPDQWSWYWAARDALGMIYCSDVDVELNVDVRDIKISDKHAGLNISERPIIECQPQWTAWGTLKKITDVKAEAINKEGIFAVRMNGLTQYFEISSTGRKNNIFVDLEASNPRADTWPLNASREGLTGEIKKQVNEFITVQDAAPLTSSSNIRMATAIVREKEYGEDNPIKVIGKNMVKGTRRSRYESSGVRHDNMFSTLTAMVMSEKIAQTESSISAGKAAVLLFFYDPPKEAPVRKWQVSVMHAWASIITMVAGDDESFGFGITSLEDTVAQRQDNEGNTYYIINPDHFRSFKNTEALFLALYQSAIHEVTHHIEGNHTEMFTSIMGMIARETLESVLEMRSKVMRKLHTFDRIAE